MGQFACSSGELGDFGQSLIFVGLADHLSMAACCSTN
jgi:hypothetical protein